MLRRRTLKFQKLNIMIHEFSTISALVRQRREVSYCIRYRDLYPLSQMKREKKHERCFMLLSFCPERSKTGSDYSLNSIFLPRTFTLLCHICCHYKTINTHRVLIFSNNLVLTILLTWKLASNLPTKAQVALSLTDLPNMPLPPPHIKTPMLILV